MATYIVTGGAGFIGSNLSRILLKEGHTIHIIDNLSGGKKESVPKEAHLHEIDITDLQVLKNFFNTIGSIDGVFHLAALPRVQYSIENPLETHTHNITGTLNVLIAAHENNVKKVVYSASSSAYGDKDEMPLYEDMKADPKSPYGLQKYVGELYCRLFSSVYKIPTVSLRYFNVYGPGLDPEGAYALVIGKFLKQRSENQKLTITGDGRQTRDFTHVRDVARANILAMGNSNVGNGEVINIGAGNNISINEIAEVIGGPVEYIPARLEPRDTLADNKKAKKLLEWIPQESFTEGMKELKNIFNIKD
jgi:nucleoside-diphosphate-sugar epimerase